jgi:hypothetical protein
MTRPLLDIAYEIRTEWTDIPYKAEPYVEAMATMFDITDPYFLGPGAMIVRDFLKNAGQWRGKTANRVKAELKAMI